VRHNVHNPWWHTCGPLRRPSAIRSPTMPFRDLGEDVLSIIFEHCVIRDWDRYADEPQWADLWGNLAAINLVCRKWRDIAVHTPSLWSILQYGRVLPTSVPHLRARIGPATSGIAFVPQAMRRLAAMGVLDRVRELFTHELPYDNDGVRVGNVERYPPNSFPAARNLEYLSMRRIPPAAEMSFKDLFRYFSAYSSVIHLSLWRLIEAKQGTPLTVTFPRLQILEVTESFRDSVEGALSLIMAPNLRKLGIRMLAVDEDDSDYRIPFDCSPPPGGWQQLRHIEWWGINTSEDMERLLLEAPNIQWLTLAKQFEPEIDSDGEEIIPIFDWTYDTLLGTRLSLAIPRTGTFLAPRLLGLRLHHVNFSFQALLHFVDSRRRARLPLRQVTLSRDDANTLAGHEVMALRERLHLSVVDD